MALFITCPTNFDIKYGVAIIKLRNARIGHALLPCGNGVPVFAGPLAFDTALNTSLKAIVD